MGETFVISGLEAKRAELAGVIGDLERRIGQHRADLCHVDAVLRLFGRAKPEEIPGKRPRRRNSWFRPGECSRIVLTVLREAARPLDTRAVTEAVMRVNGMDTADDHTRAMLQKAILETLGRSAGPIERIAGLSGQTAA